MRMVAMMKTGMRVKERMRDMTVRIRTVTAFSEDWDCSCEDCRDRRDIRESKR